MSFLIAKFDNFSGGEYGSLGPLSAPPDSFTGNNVIRYLDGSLGPRPGFSQLLPTGLPTKDVYGLGAVVGSSIPKIVWYTPSGSPATLRGFDYPNGADSSLGSLVGSVALRSQIINYGAVAVLGVRGDGVYQFDNTSGVLTHLTGGPAGSFSTAVYGRYLMAANSITGGANRNRIFFSKRGDFTTWDANDEFDVSSSQWDITYLQELNNRLAIANDGDEWWSLSGTPGVNDVLRRTPRADLSPARPWCATRLGESVWFLSDDDDFPVQFTTSVVNPLRYRHLSFAQGGTKESRCAATLPGVECVMFTESSTKRALVLYNGAWTFHTLGVTPNELTPLTQGGNGIAATPLILADNSAAAPAFYEWAPYLDRPGKVSDTVAQPGDGSITPLDAGFTTTVFRSGFVRRGHQFFPGTGDLTVEVNFNKWNTESAKTNHISLQVRALYRMENDTTDSAKQEWSESPTATTSDKTPARYQFRFGDQGEADAYQLVFSDLRGVAIVDAQVYRDAD